jgi:hypothetical protein
MIKIYAETTETERNCSSSIGLLECPEFSFNGERIDYISCVFCKKLFGGLTAKEIEDKLKEINGE